MATTKRFDVKDLALAAEGIRRIEALASGRVKGLTEEEFLATLK